MKSKNVQFLVLNFVSFLGQLAISVINLSLVYYLRYTLTSSATLIGLAASTYTTTYLLGCMFFTSFYQNFRPRYTIIVSVLGMAMSIFSVTQSNNIVIVFISLVFYGLSMSMLWPQLESWITRDLEGKDLTIATSAFNFSWSLGTGISSFVATLLVAITPSIGLFSGIISFVMIFLIMFVIRYVKDIKNVDAEKYHIEATKINAKDDSTILRFYSWITMFLVYTGLSIVLNIFPLFAKEILVISDAKAGFLLFIRGMATCFAFYYFGRYFWWTFKPKLIFTVQALYVLVLLFAAKATNSVTITLFFIVFGILFALSYSFSIFHSASGAIDRGKRMTIHECVLTVGTIIGATCGGFIYDKLGYNNVFYFFALIAFFLLIVQLSVYKIRKHSALK